MHAILLHGPSPRTTPGTASAILRPGPHRVKDTAGPPLGHRFRPFIRLFRPPGRFRARAARPARILGAGGNSHENSRAHRHLDPHRGRRSRARPRTAACRRPVAAYALRQCRARRLLRWSRRRRRAVRAGDEAVRGRAGQGPATRPGAGVAWGWPLVPRRAGGPAERHRGRARSLDPRLARDGQGSGARPRHLLGISLRISLLITLGLGVGCMLYESTRARLEAAEAELRDKEIERERPHARRRGPARVARVAPTPALPVQHAQRDLGPDSR